MNPNSMKEESTFETLVARIRTAHRDLSAYASRAVNISLTLRNGLIGYYIAEYELKGKDRAEYGQGLFSALAKELKGLSNCNQRQLYRYHRFFQLYPEIVGTLSPQFRSLPVLKEIPISGTASPLSCINEQMKEVGE
jgi:hypothetical protein